MAVPSHLTAKTYLLKQCRRRSWEFTKSTDETPRQCVWQRPAQNTPHFKVLELAYLETPQQRSERMGNLLEEQPLLKELRKKQKQKRPLNMRHLKEDLEEGLLAPPPLP
jgi:hypothetical protein